MAGTIERRKLFQKTLQKVKILKTLDTLEQLAIADALELVTFNDGARVITQGEEGHEFFIVVSGTAVVTQATADDAAAVVAELAEGDYFGEIALLTGDTRHASVTAKGPLKCAQLHRNRFERVLGPVRDLMRRDMEHYNEYHPPDA